MNFAQNRLRWLIAVVTALLFGIFLIGCSSEPAEEGTTDAREHEAEAEMLVLPELEAAELDGEPLKVVATTNIMGDVVAQVGGEAIELTTLLGPGQDPHSYVPAARDLTAVSGADVIFVNGWDLEEGLANDVQNIAVEIPIVPISANIEPLPFGEKDSADPHVWFDVQNVEQWVENAAQVLGELDPANATVYEENGAAYREELGALDSYAKEQLAEIPEAQRFLVTNHDAFGYLAEAYGLTTLGTVIPGASTLAEPSASDLTGLIAKMEEHGLCTIFTETAVSDTLAQTVAGELSNCKEVKVLALYSGSIGTADSGANSYLTMFRTNVDTIVAGLE